MKLNWVVERYGVTNDILNVVNSLVDDDLYSKEACAKELVSILRQHDLINRSIAIDELDQNKSTAEEKSA